ncbi:MAG: DHH family phosphoesterase, partial [Thermoplasmata archaeon]|nr:DHH family phosphoesterase [Thermoplasmata archaeon]
MKQAAMRVAERIRRASHMHVVSHIDADGVSAAAVASVALDAVGMKHEVIFTKKLDEAFVEELRNKKPELVWFTDLGSGSLEMLNGLDCVITDHHAPSTAPSKSGRKTLFDFAEPINDVLQVNPHLVGRDGGTDISGAGCAYLVAKSLDSSLGWLAHIAIVGAVGDMQDRATGRLTGTNREILADGEKAGTVEAIEDLNLFGRETRPVWKMLQY